MTYQPDAGIYDLSISGATYERDNGKFECRMVEGGTGKRLHSSTVDLVVLLPPSHPVMRPTDPIVTELKPFNLSCSTIGQLTNNHG